MPVEYGPRVVTDGLVLALDAADINSFDEYENLFVYSEEYNQGNWIKSGSTITANVVTAPDGFNTADKLIGNNGNTGRQSVYQLVSVTSGVTYTFSVFLKQAERRYGCIWFDDFNISQGPYYGSATYFDLQTGTIAFGNQTKIVPYPNGWYRVYITATPSFTGTLSLNTAIGTPNNSSDGSGTAAYQYTGDGVSGFYVWGAQFERGSSVTNYYPTTGTTKIRGSTWIDLTGNSNNGTLTNGPTYNIDNGGSIVFDGTNDYVIATSPGTYSEYTFMFFCKWISSTTNGSRIFGLDSFGTYTVFTPTNVAFHYNPLGGVPASVVLSSGINVGFGNWCQVAVSVSSSSTAVKIYVNGILGNTSSTLPSGSFAGNLYLGAQNTISTVVANANVAMFQLYNRALTASEVQQNFNALRGRFGI